MAFHHRRPTPHAWAIYLSIVLIALLAACGRTSPYTPATPQPVSARPALLDQPFTLQGGKAAIIERDAAGGDLKEALVIRFESVRNDSRCPAGVQCAELGDATVVVVAQLGSREPVTLELHTSPPLQVATIAYGRYPIHLVSLDPLPAQPGDLIKLQDYSATLLVRPELPPPPEAPSSVPPLETDAHRPVLGERFSVQGGQTAYVDTPADANGSKIELRFAAVSSDSRCPRLVQCVVAGDAGILLVASFGSQHQQLTLHTTPPLKQDHAWFVGYDIQLVALDPIRDRPEDTLELNQYTAELIVTHVGAAPIATQTPVPSQQAQPPYPRTALNACTLASFDMLARHYGEIEGQPQPQINPTDGSQECTVRMARATITIRFLLGDQQAAEALLTELRQTGLPMSTLDKEILGYTSYGENQQQAMLVTYADTAIYAIGVTFGAQAQPADRAEARSNLDVFQSMAFARYLSGQVEPMPTPGAP